MSDFVRMALDTVREVEKGLGKPSRNTGETVVISQNKFSNTLPHEVRIGDETTRVIWISNEPRVTFDGTRPFKTRECAVDALWDLAEPIVTEYIRCGTLRRTAMRAVSFSSDAALNFENVYRTLDGWLMVTFRMYTGTFTEVTMRACVDMAIQNTLNYSLLGFLASNP